MLITEIEINGLEPHKDISLKPLSKFNVFVGANNSGKSTILEAIPKFIHYNQGNVQNYHKELHGENNQYTIIWWFTATLEEIYGGEEAGNEAIKSLKSHLKDKVKKTGIQSCVELIVSFRNKKIIKASPFGIFEIGGITLFQHENYEPGRVPDGFADKITGYFKGYFEELTRRHEISKTQLVSYVPCIRTLQRKDIMSQLRDGRYSNKYQSFVNQFQEFFTTFPLLRHTSQEVFSIVGENPDGSEIMFPFNLEGGGCLRAYEILNEIFLLKEAVKDVQNKTINIKPLLIIDEPELSMHAELQRKILLELIEFSNEAQIFLATHSPIFTNPMRDHTIILLPTARSEEKLKHITKVDLNEISNALGLRNRDYFMYNTIVFLEGNTEMEFLLQLLDESGLDLFDFGIDIRNLQGVDTSRQKFTETIFDLILNFNIKIIIKTDKEGKAVTTKTKLYDKFRHEKKEKEFVWEFWDTNFEANFSPDILFKTLKRCAADYNKTFSISSDEFNAILEDTPDENRSNKIREIYHAQTMCGLDQNQFGRFLSSTTLKNIKEHRDNEVIRYFVDFFDKLRIEILPGLKRVHKGAILLGAGKKDK